MENKKSVEVEFDLNQTPLSSPRDAVEGAAADGDDDDVLVIEPPPTLRLRRKGDKAAAFAGCGGSSRRPQEVAKEPDLRTVVCTGCGEGFSARCLGTAEEIRQWKCLRCLLKNGGGGGGKSGGSTGVGGGGVALLDINASPPREGDADGVCVAPTAHFASRGGDRNPGFRLQGARYPSFSSQPISLFSAFSDMLGPDNRFHLQKAPQIQTDIAKSGFDDKVDHRRPFDASSNKIDLGSTNEGRARANHSTSNDSFPQTPNELYLQGLREYIAERKGVLNDGWHVEFEFCNNRLKTFAVFHAPDGRRFESLSEVAHHLGLPSNAQSLLSESLTQGNQRRNEFAGSMRTGNSRQKLNNPKSSSPFGSLPSGVENINTPQDGFPIRFEDFYLISVGVIDLRPSYHQSNQIWPVGYRSIWHDKITGSLFVCEVTDGGDSGPNFSVRRYPCALQTMPSGSTVLSRSKVVSLTGEDDGGKDDLSRFGVIDEESMSIQLMLTDSSPPLLDDTGNEGIDSLMGNLPSLGSFSQQSGHLISDTFEQKDSIGEFVVEGTSPSSLWEKVLDTFLRACDEAYKKKGAIRFGCEHGFNETYVKDLHNLDSLSKFSHLACPIDISHMVHSDEDFHSTRDSVAKWLRPDRFGLDAEFVQEVIEQLPGVSGCSEYTLLIKRKHDSTLQTVRSGFLKATRKRNIEHELISDGYRGSLKRPREHSEHSALRGAFPRGKPLCSKLPAYLIGDALQVWEFLWRFSEVVGLQTPFSFQELEDELINPWSDCLYPVDKLGTEIHDSQYVFSQSSRDVSIARVRIHSCQRCTGIILSKSHGSLLKLLVGELLSRVAVYVDPNFDAGESKSRRGRRKDAEYSAIIKKMKLDTMPVNEVTWPEIARRYILAVLSMEGNLDSAEIACRESGKVFHCLRGDGGILCGSLTGVAAMEADASLLAEATKKIFGLLEAKNMVMSMDQNDSVAEGASSRTIEADDGEVPEWARVLEPVRKLPTNVGARIRRCIYEALEKNPPEWARKKLEHSISREVYKGNASGPTKRAVISLLQDVIHEKLQPKPEKKEKVKSVNTVSDLIMKQCRIVLRHAIAADEDRVFCNLLGRTLLNPNDNDDEGLLGYPTMVSRPLDFRTIDLRLAAGAYGGSHEAFVDDVREVWHNVRTAYREQPDLIDLAGTLSKKFEDLYEKEVLTFVQKTTVGTNNSSSTSEAEKERDEMLACASEISLPKAPWDDGICKVCGMDKDDDNVLLCDKCDSEYHTYCLNPPLIRIPEGNWYCPSCVAGESVTQQNAAYCTQVLNQCGRRRYQRENIHKVLEMLAQLANKMELKEYWEFTLEERLFLMKFLCDETLNSATIHDHIDQCSFLSADLQQQLRSLNCERKILKFREESFPGKTKSNMHRGGGEVGLDRSNSVLANEAQLPDGNTVSPLPGGLTQMEDGPNEFGDPLDKSFACTNSQNSKVASASSQFKYQQSGKDHSPSNHTKAPDCINTLLVSTLQQKDGQNEDNLGSDVDLCEKIRDSSSSVSAPSLSQPMLGHELSGTVGKQVEVHVPLLHCSNPANMHPSQECNAELNNIQNEISGMQDSVDTVESELLKVSVRKEFVGRDSDGRLYWIFRRPGACPWILVNGNLDAAEKFGRDNLFPNFTSWMSYNAVTEVEELVNWLDDGDIRERELKESILQWQNHKSVETSSAESDILNRGKPSSGIPSNGEKIADPDFLVTKAMRTLEKKFGTCLKMWVNDIHKDDLVDKGKVIYQGPMHRCACLELLWPSRQHCFSCHCSFSTSEDFTQHTAEKCKTVSTFCNSYQSTEDTSKNKRTMSNQPAEKCSGSLSAGPTYPNEKHDNRSSFVERPQEPECPFNFEEIKAKFKTEDSLKELVKEIGLIGSDSVVPFVSSSPYPNDPALTWVPLSDNVVSRGDEPSVPESRQKLSDKGTNIVAGANNRVLDYLRRNESGKREEVAKAECVKPMSLSGRGQFSSMNDKSSVLGILKSSVICESYLRPKVGKAFEILQFLKINLLDIDAALPEVALRASRSHFNRRCAWRSFVKSATTLYEMVLAMIILEDTIKTDYLRNDWWYWSSPSAAANISTLSALALRIYTLDSAILYEKPSLSDDKTLGPDCKTDKEVTQSSAPSSNLKPGDQPMQKVPDTDSGENSRPRTRTSKRRKDIGG